METARFGEFVKKHRLLQRLSLRAFCQKFGEDPSNWSKMERGLLKPPSGTARLWEIAEKIGITGDAEKQHLFDLADVERGRIPVDILKNEEFMASLPVVFRTIRGETPEVENLLKLVDLIREDMTPRNEEAK